MIESTARVYKAEILLIILLLFASLVVRDIYLSGYRNTDSFPYLKHSDGYYYYLWGRDIAEGRADTNKAFMKWPLYAYFLAFLFKFFSKSAPFVYHIQFLLGAANCLLVYFIARRIFNKTVAVICSIFFIWYGLFIFYEGLLIYTTLSLFLNSLLLLYLLNIKDNLSLKRLFLLGVFLGACCLAQGNVIFFGVLACIFILWQKEDALPKALYQFFAFALGLILVLGAVTLRNYLAEKDFVFIQGNTGINFYMGNNPKAGGRFDVLNFTPDQSAMFRETKLIAQEESGRLLKTSEVSNFWFKRSLNFMKEDFASYAKLLFKKFIYVWSPLEYVHDHEYYYIKDQIPILKFLLMDLKVILPFTFLGMILGLGDFKKLALVYLALICFSASIILFFVVARYRIVMVPYLIIFAGFGLYSLWRQLRRKNYRLLFLSVVFLALLFYLFNYSIRFTKDSLIIDQVSGFRYYIHKALLLEQRGRCQEALEELKYAEMLNPNTHNLALAAGSLYYNLGNFKLAEEKFKEATSRNPFYVDAYYNLGYLYNGLGRFQEAKAALEKAASLDPQDREVQLELEKANAGLDSKPALELK